MRRRRGEEKDILSGAEEGSGGMDLGCRTWEALLEDES